MFSEGHPHFEMAAGTVLGRSHALAGRANQDAVVLRVEGGALVAVVADGCGGAERSEVGAWFGAHALATEVGRAAGGDLDEAAFWEGVRGRVLSAVHATALAMGGDFQDIVRRFFLFTVVGVVVTAERAAVFSLGDGLVVINGEVLHLGPFPGNAPPYLGHALLGGEGVVDTRLVVHRTMPAREVESVVVATDGAAEWSDVCARRLPGSSEAVGPLAQLWQDDRFFEHPDALRRKLARMNRAFVPPVREDRPLSREPGLLEDDTTIAVVRARKSAVRSSD